MIRLTLKRAAIRCAGLCAAVCLILALSIPFTFAQAQPQQVASLKLAKSITGVSPDDVVSFQLMVENNGTVPVIDVEVYEYLNTALNGVGSIAVTSPAGDASFPMSSSGLATAAQVIVDPPPPASLNPGQSLTLQYKMHAPSPGDFQVPADLVWFSYLRGGSTIRSNYYSNGLILHVPNGYEKVVILIYPYVLSILTFTAVVTILFWARGRLKEAKK